MMIKLVGKKIGMTRIINDNGSSNAVSVVELKPNIVVQRKITTIDGYNALQMTTGKKVNRKNEAKINKVNKAIKGHYKRSKQDIGLGLWESKVADNELELLDQDIFDVSVFSVGHFVDVTGVSKGKGFQGGVKRHNFSMQDATHGNSVSHRALGSTGQCQDPGRVFKGKKMAGQMGNKKVSEQCLEVLNVDYDNNLLLIKGAIPGRNGGFVAVRLSVKKNEINTKITKDLIIKNKSHNKSAAKEQVEESVK